MENKQNKNFDNWNQKKKQIQAKRGNKLYHARDVWWCSLGVNVGFEHDGDGSEYQRPVLVLKGLSANTCLVIPLTLSLHKHPMRVPVGIIGGKHASAVISQMRVIDTKRLLGRICFLDNSIFECIRKTVRDML